VSDESLLLAMMSRLSDLERQVADLRGLSGAAPSSATPAALGTAAVGTSKAFARGDHVHPWQSSGARVHNTSTITLTTATLTVLTFNSERYDTDSYHSTSSNTGRLTAPADGSYFILANVRFAANSIGERRLVLLLNGTTNIAYKLFMPVTTGSVTLEQISTIYQLSAGDYVEVQAYQTSGGNLNVEVTGNYSPEFMIARV